MRIFIPLLLTLLIGCSSNKVPFNIKTVVSFNDNDIEYKLDVEATADTTSGVPGVIKIYFRNNGTEEFWIFGQGVFYEDASGKITHALNRFVAWQRAIRSIRETGDIYIPSGERNFMLFKPPQEATTLVFKNDTHDKVLFKVSLK